MHSPNLSASPARVKVRFRKTEPVWEIPVRDCATPGGRALSGDTAELEMKKLAPVLLIGLSLLCGCAHTYVITLSDGRRITTASKPRLENGRYTFKDASGVPSSVPSGRVREIAPASMVKEEKPMFNAQPGTK
jgi:hypothetical protein